MSRFSLEAKVGLFVLLAVIAMGYMSLKVGGLEWETDKGYDVTVFFDSASGLNVDVPVEIAGVEVGRVKKVGLDKNKAKVTLRLMPNIRLTKDAEAVIRTKGILGDKYVELQPGSPSAPPLAPGGRIVRTYTPTDMDTIMKQVSDIAKDIRKVSQSLAGAVGSAEGQKNLEAIISNMRQMSEALNTAVLAHETQASAIIENLADFSIRLKEMGQSNEGDVRQIIVALKEASGRLEKTLGSMAQISEKINDGEGSLGMLVNENKTIKRLDNSLASLESITGTIARGEGTLGRLIKDDETVDELNGALAGINQYLGKQDTFRTYLGYSGEYLTEESGLKSYVTLRIQPKQDRYYLVQVVSDPMGREKVTDTVTTTNGVTIHKHRVETEMNSLKFSAQVAKRYYDLVIRAGLLESTGGVGFDYYLWNDRMALSFEAFDFDPDERPHLKFKAEYELFPHVYLNAGVDDFISDRGRRSFFAGAGINFADQDIKTLMGSIPISK